MKRVLLAEGLLEVEVPVDWVLRATTLPDGERVEGAVPREYAEWELAHLPEGVASIVHRTSAALRDLAEARMRRFVARGELETFDDVIGTERARGYAWTDGLHDIATWFARPADGFVVEIHVTLPGLSEPSHRDRDPIARGRALICGARWIR